MSTVRGANTVPSSIVPNPGEEVAPPPAPSPPDIEDYVPPALLDALRYLVDRIELNEPGALPPRLAVTSSIHGEGVTTISLNLAGLIAHDLDRRVCWLDLSGSTRRARREEATSGPIGIIDILAGRSTLEQALHLSYDPRLVMLPAGDASTAGERNFARSAALVTLIDELEQRFDTLVLDFPPVLAGSDALSLMRHASSYLLVVRHGVTTSNQVKQAAEELTSVPALGVVLNQFRSKLPQRIEDLFMR